MALTTQEYFILLMSCYIRQASSTQLPVSDLAAAWSKICNSAFAYLEGIVIEELPDKQCLPHLPAVLTRETFGTAVRGTMSSRRHESGQIFRA